MSAIDLLQPLLDGGVKRNNFFNGRLLSAEDLRTEQDATRDQLRDHGRAFGDGVAWGLNVEVVTQGPAQPTVRVTRGLAFNCHGDALRLGEDVEVRLVPETVASEVLAGVFAACEQPRPQAAITGAGAWVLTAAPTSGFRESATVSDPNATAVGRGACGARYQVEGLAFRLAPIAVDEAHGLVPEGVDPTGSLESALRTRIDALLADTRMPQREQLRNVLAHACYGSGTLRAAFTEPLRRYTNAARQVTNAPVWVRWGLLDAMRERGDLTGCEVALALVVLDAGGIRLLDLWSVRRRPVDAHAVQLWRVPAGARRAAEGEAAFLQFQSQLEIVRAASTTPMALAARDWFDWLPPAGWLPLGSGGFDWKNFLGDHAPAAVTDVDAALLRGIVERSWLDEPFQVTDTPPVPLRVCRVPGDNAVVFARSHAAQLRLVFTPAPVATEAFAATIEPRSGAVVESRIYSGGAMRIGELAPGHATLTLESPDYQTVTREVDLVGARTTDVAIALTAIQNGSILVTANDKATGAAIGTQVDDIVVTGTAPVTAAQHATRQANGQWLVIGLAAGSYAVSGTASGYKAAALATAAAVTATARTNVTLDFERIPTTPGRPERCISVSSVAPLETLKKKLRLCMVLAGAVFESGNFAKKRPTRTAETTAPGVKFAAEKRKPPRPGFEIAPNGELLYGEDNVPWEKMTRVQPEPDELRPWLAAWRDWLAVAFDDQAIADSTPVLYVDEQFRELATGKSVGRTPPAYAVFGPMAVPVSIGVQELSTKGPVDIRDGGLKGIPEPIYKALDEHDIRTINDVVWIWDEIMQDITGDPQQVVDLTIAEAQAQVADINTNQRYYAGVDAAAQSALKKAGLTTDESIAKADLQVLTQAVGSEAFALRLQQQAQSFTAK